MWQDDWKRACSILLNIPRWELELDEEYARNIVLEGYYDSAWEQFGPAGVAEFVCRPVWSFTECERSRARTALGKFDQKWEFPEEALCAIKRSVAEIFKEVSES